jgi:hypothetical protein
MKLISALLLSVIVGVLSYSAGEQNKAETVKTVSSYALSFGYICGAFRDPACLSDYKQ